MSAASSDEKAQDESAQEGSAFSAERDGSSCCGNDNSKLSKLQSSRIEALTQIPRGNPSKKCRWSKKAKKEAQRQRTIDKHNPSNSSPATPVRGRPGRKRARSLRHQKSVLSATESLLLLARELQFTQSITLMNDETSSLAAIKENAPSDSPRPAGSETQLKRVEVVTTTGDVANRPPESNGGSLQSDSGTFRILTQPLLVLDLNGILCHRVRRLNTQQQLTEVQFRQKVASIAGTPIIPRTDQTFLEFLDKYFCLAVWTSAKAKTAKQLVKLLFPDPVAERLLFVWAQNKCEVFENKSDPDDGPFFEKDLSKVWKEYPIWDASNTLIIDDSPDKCPAWKANAIHPPALHGRAVVSCEQNDHMTNAIASDEQNEAMQRRFFALLVQHWKDHPTSRVVHEEDTVEPAGRSQLLSFLQNNGTGHMGWSYRDGSSGTCGVR